MGSRIENRIRKRRKVSHTSRDAIMAAVAGGPMGHTTLQGDVMGFLQEKLKAFTPIRSRNSWLQCGIWPHGRRLRPGSILGCHGVKPRVTITVQFSHRDRGLGVGARTGCDISGCRLHAERIFTTKAMGEENLESVRHGTVLTKGQSSDDKVGRERGLGDWDYTTCPTTSRWIRAVVLFFFP